HREAQAGEQEPLTSTGVRTAAHFGNGWTAAGRSDGLTPPQQFVNCAARKLCCRAIAHTISDSVRCSPLFDGYPPSEVLVIARIARRSLVALLVLCLLLVGTIAAFRLVAALRE